MQQNIDVIPDSSVIPDLDDNTLRLLYLYRKAAALYAEVYEHGVKMRQECNDPRNEGQQADRALLCKQVAEHLDAATKDLNKTQAACAGTSCRLWAKTDLDPPIRGKVAVASPSNKKGVKIPSPNSDPEAYTELMEYLGVPVETSMLVRVHYPSLRDRISEILEQGGKLPQCIKNLKEYDEFGLTLRKAVGWDIDEAVQHLE